MNSRMSKSNPIQSPCVRNCCLDDDDICLGCFRTITEITSWSEADDNGRLNILHNAKIRRDEHTVKLQENNVDY
jgi:hypothetical protein